MATVTVTATPTTLDATGAAELAVTNTGGASVYVNTQRLRPGQRNVFDTSRPLQVTTQGGETSTVDTTVSKASGGTGGGGGTGAATVLRLGDYGAKCDGTVGYYGVATAGSATLTDPNAAFAGGLVGQKFTMRGAGAAGGVWFGTVTAVPNATTLTISTPAGTTSTITGTAGAMTAGSQVLTDATFTFTQALMGATITVNGAGAAGANLTGQILSPTADGHGVYLISSIGNQNLAANAGTTVTAATYTINRGRYTIGSDDSAAWAAAIGAAGVNATTGAPSTIQWAGTSMVTTMPILPGNVVLQGQGKSDVQTGTAYPTRGSILRAHGDNTDGQVIRLGAFSQYREDYMCGGLKDCTIDAAQITPWAVKSGGNWYYMDRVHARNGSTGAMWLNGWQTMMRDCTFGQPGYGDGIFVQEADAQMNGGYIKSAQNLIHCGTNANDLMLTGVHTYNSWPAVPGTENRTILIDAGCNRLTFTGCYFDNIYGPQVRIVPPAGGVVSEVEFNARKFFQAGTPWYTFPDVTYPVFQLDNSAGGGSIIERMTVNGCSGSAVWSGARFSTLVNYVTNTGVSAITFANTSISNCAALYTGSTPAQTSMSHVKVLDSGPGVWRTSPFPQANTNPLTATGTGAQTAFPIAHNMSGIPKRVSVLPQTAAAAAPFYVTLSSTNITINYTTAPAASAALAWFIDASF